MLGLCSMRYSSFVSMLAAFHVLILITLGKNFLLGIIVWVVGGEDVCESCCCLLNLL